jgi:hypothetical protein
VIVDLPAFLDLPRSISIVNGRMVKEFATLNFVPAFPDSFSESCEELGGQVAVVTSKYEAHGSGCAAANPNIVTVVEILPMCILKSSCVTPQQFADEAKSLWSLALESL